MLSFHLFFFFNDTATTEIYTLSLHDALPISIAGDVDPIPMLARESVAAMQAVPDAATMLGDRKSTRLNSSHSQISYAVFCLKKKKERQPASNVTKSVALHICNIHISYSAGAS